MDAAVPRILVRLRRVRVPNWAARLQQTCDRGPVASAICRAKPEWAAAAGGTGVRAGRRACRMNRFNV
jgi:hypothetical protein